MAKKQTQKDDVSKGILGALPPGLREEMDGFNEMQLKTCVVQSTAIMRASKKQMKLDTELEAAKQRVKDLSEDYVETRKTKEATISYALYLLDAKGVDLKDEFE